MGFLDLGSCRRAQSDPVRTAVPKAYVVLAPGYTPTSDTAEAILGMPEQSYRPMAEFVGWNLSPNCPNSLRENPTCRASRR